MRKERVEQLKILYEAPKPTGKRRFFRSLEQRPLSMGRMVWIQCAYMPKWEWILAAFLFVVIVLVSHIGQQAVLSIGLAIMPFLAVTDVSGSFRSITYGMNELEQAARFSLKSIVLARMGIVGVENMLLTVLFALVMGGEILGTVLYLLAPYLATCYGSLILMRKMPEKEGIYFCAGLAALVILMMFVVTLDYRWFWIFETQYVYLWLLAVCVLLVLVVKEGNRTVHTLETVFG